MLCGVHPFRFIAPAPRWTGDLRAWQDGVRRIEDLGYDTVSISDHLSGGWSLDPWVGLQAAAGVTSRLQLLTLVVNNDFRHPLVLHRSAANLDVFSGGRLVLGLGAGWSRADYDVSGIPFDRPGVRIDRLAETVTVLKALFAGGRVDFEGAHHVLRGAEGVPLPVRRPHPPLLLGGGGPRMLGLAGREADVVGIHARLGSGVLDAESVRDLSAAAVAEKVEVVRSAARSAGRDPAELVLQFSLYHVQIGEARTAGARPSTFARLFDEQPDLVAGSPAVLHGSPAACIEQLQRMREELGLSYLSLGSDVEAAAPVVAALAGT